MTATSLASPTVGEPVSIRVSSHRLWAFLGLLLSLGGIAFGIWILAQVIHDWSNPRSIKGAWAGFLGVPLFCWIGWLMILRLASGYGTYVGPDGLTVPGPTYLPKLIPWVDIEAITSFKIRANSFTGIRLRTYAHLIPQYSKKETKILLRRNRWLGRVLRVSSPTGIIQTGIDKDLASTGNWKGLAEYFAGQRQAYGCDFMLGAIDRDRGAEDFAKYLEAFRQKYSPLTQTGGAIHA